MKIETEVKLDSISDDGACSLRRSSYIMVDGVKQYLDGSNVRLGLTPLDMTRALSFVYDGDIPSNESARVSHPIIAFLNNIWTDEIKEAWEEKLHEMEVDEVAHE